MVVVSWLERQIGCEEHDRGGSIVVATPHDCGLGRDLLQLLLPRSYRFRRSSGYLLRARTPVSRRRIRGCAPVTPDPVTP